MPNQLEIAPRRSMIFFALLAILIIIASYVFVVILAALCVLLPYYAVQAAEQPGFALPTLFAFGVIIAGAFLWSLVPKRDSFVQPGPLLERSIHPRLFEEIDRIAAALNEPVPIRFT